MESGADGMRDGAMDLAVNRIAASNAGDEDEEIW